MVGIKRQNQQHPKSILVFWFGLCQWLCYYSTVESRRILMKILLSNDTHVSINTAVSVRFWIRLQVLIILVNTELIRTFDWPFGIGDNRSNTPRQCVIHLCMGHLYWCDICQKSFKRIDLHLCLSDQENSLASDDKMKELNTNGDGKSLTFIVYSFLLFTA